MSNELYTWTIYEKRTDRDFPNCFVCVEFSCAVNPPQMTGRKFVCADVEQIRAELQMRGFYRMPRDVVDDDSIIETWI